MQRDSLALPGAEQGPGLNQPVVLNRPYLWLCRANATQLLTRGDGRVVATARAAASPSDEANGVAVADPLLPEGPARRQIPPPANGTHIVGRLRLTEKLARRPCQVDRHLAGLMPQEEHLGVWRRDRCTRSDLCATAAARSAPLGNELA